VDQSANTDDLGSEENAGSCTKCNQVSDLVECSSCGDADMCKECLQKVRNMEAPKYNPEPKPVKPADPITVQVQRLSDVRFVRNGCTHIAECWAAYTSLHQAEEAERRVLLEEENEADSHRLESLQSVFLSVGPLPPKIQRCRKHR
jgi:hypothetical protein